MGPADPIYIRLRSEFANEPRAPPFGNLGRVGSSNLFASLIFYRKNNKLQILNKGWGGALLMSVGNLSRKFVTPLLSNAYWSDAYTVKPYRN